MGTNQAVNKLEVHHVTMLQDLRGRIVRCDNSIAKHTKDIIYLMDEIRRLEMALQNCREKLSGDIHRLEAEVSQPQSFLLYHLIICPYYINNILCQLSYLHKNLKRSNFSA